MSLLKPQKERILSLVKAAEKNKDFSNHYLLPYQEFFDTRHDFTEFNCERMEGKANYLTLIDELTSIDQDTKVFVEVSGFEEDGDDIWICADTLIISSKLYLSDIRQIFENPIDIDPSEIGSMEGFTEKDMVISKDGILHPMHELCDREYNYYFCWWD